MTEFDWPILIIQYAFLNHVATLSHEYHISWSFLRPRISVIADMRVAKNDDDKILFYSFDCGRSKQKEGREESDRFASIDIKE